MENTREPESSAGTKGALHTAHGWLRCDAKCLMKIVTSFMPKGTAVTLAMLSPIAQPESANLGITATHDDSVPSLSRRPSTSGSIGLRSWWSNPHSDERTASQL